MSEELEFLESVGSEAGKNTNAIIEQPRYVGEPKLAENEPISDFCMWSTSGSSYFPCEATVNALPPAVYGIEVSQTRGIYFKRRSHSMDGLIYLPDSASDEVIEGIKTFWDREQAYRDYGFLWKRGVLLWGPPGSGKTSTVQLLIAEIVRLGGVAIYVDHPALATKALPMLRQIEPARPLIIVLEDIDAITSRYGEPELLSLLDGECQIDNVVFIATTNYPERLDKRIINRPSRFDVIRKIGMPNAAARRIYLAEKNLRFKSGADKAEVQKWVDATEGFSIAHMKELIVSVEVFGHSMGGSVEQLRAMQNIKISSEQDESRSLGFLGDCA